MNCPKSGSTSRSKTDRTTTSSKTQLNNQVSSNKQPSKQKSEQRVSSKTRQENNYKGCSTIVVCDRGTQCNRYTEGLNKLDPAESAQLISVMNNLRGLKKDGTSSKVISYVEQLLCTTFSLDLGNTVARNKQNNEVVLLQSKLQKFTAELKAANKKQEETNALFQKEKETLDTKLQEQKRLVESREYKIRMLMQKLQEEKKTTEILKKQLSKEIQNNLIAEQHLEFEKEKNQILLKYKNKLLEDLRLMLKDLQNSAVEQFANLREADEDHELMMLVNKKFTCLSSSKSSSEDESSPYDTIPWKDETETNLSETSNKFYGAQFENNGYNCDKEGNRILNIEDDLISLPNEDQPVSENSCFGRDVKPRN